LQQKMRAVAGKRATGLKNGKSVPTLRCWGGIKTFVAMTRQEGGKTPFPQKGGGGKTVPKGTVKLGKEAENQPEPG